MNQRDLLIRANPFWLSMREQMYNCQNWSANSLKAGSAAPDRRYKVAPTGVISPQKCGRWHFENAVGRENPAKSRPMDSSLRLHRARCRLTMVTRLFRCYIAICHWSSVSGEMGIIYMFYARCCS